MIELRFVEMYFQKMFLFSLLLIVSPIVLAADISANSKKEDSVVEVSIIGNTELPNASFSLPWRLPSIEKREDQSPSSDVKSVLKLIEPVRHKKMVHFSRYLEVDLPEFKTR